MSGPLITDEYRSQQAALHATGRYGRAAKAYARMVAQYMDRLKITSLLDYGCGSNRSLLTALPLPADVVYEGYDPCVPEYSADPLPADLVVCIDVLEHIEPELLDNVLDHLASLCDPYGFFSIHLGPAAKTLPDGRNAHLIQQPPAWWRLRLEPRFKVLQAIETPRALEVLVKRRAA